MPDVKEKNPMTPAEDLLTMPIARHVWQTRYRQAGPREPSVRQTWNRVATALAAVEQSDQPAWKARFQEILEGFQFLPGGRILAGAGTRRRATLFNCFVMGTLDTDAATRDRLLQEAEKTMAYGGGIGIDFSPASPAAPGADGPDVIALMEQWDAMCATIGAKGERRGAMMATLRCDHPDILAFIDAKHGRDRLHHFNLSVLITDAFMQAVDAGGSWELRFPILSGRVFATLPARQLWDTIVRAAHACGDPGLLFVDRINHLNNLWYCETITATNPCGEVPLPPYGACNLGSVNLTRLVRTPFTDDAQIDLARVAEIASVAVRLLDNVIDASRYPLKQQQTMVQGCRRIGLGITGLADAFVMLGLRYGDDRSISVARDVMRTICHAAYRQSVALAREKGCFPAFDRDAYLAAPFIQRLPDDIRAGIADHGIRNSHLLAIAPTGTISLLAGNVSSGIEPIFAAEYQRRVVSKGGGTSIHALTDFAVHAWRERRGETTGVPPAMVGTEDVSPQSQIAMQAVLSGMPH